MRIFSGAMGTTLAMMLTMAVGSSSILAVAVSAPDSASDIGINATYVGYFTGLVYFVSMFTGSFCTGFVTRFGPIRVLQFTGIFTILGLALFTLSSPLTAVLCALCLGVAYGPINPANAPVLLQVTHPGNRAVMFSIKQSGVTVGGAAASILVPFAAVWWNWQAGIIAVALLGAVSIVILQRLNSKFTNLRTDDPFQWSLSAFISPVLQIMKIPLLRGYSMVGFTYAGVQICVGSFFVVFLVERDFTLVEAGLCFLVVNIGGILGRVAWGGVADKLLTPSTTLTLIGIVSTISIGALLFISVDWNFFVLNLFFFILGASTHGWNGVFLSETADRAPAGESHNWTGGVQFIIYAGVAILPPVFGAMVLAISSYSIPFISIALASLTASLFLKWLYANHADNA